MSQSIQPPPSYHDLHITTAKIPRTSIFNLPYGLEVTCTRMRGWCLWAHGDSSWAGLVRDGKPVKQDIDWPVAPRSKEPVLVAGEYDRKWLVLDVGGHVIVDSQQKVEA